MAKADQRIYQQIENTADFYEPSIYQLLSFYQALETQPEPLDGQFIPLSTVQYRSSSETKIFAVGLIPPSSNVTGRILDRSASIRNGGSGVTVGVDENIDLPEEVPDVRGDPFLVRPNAGLVENGKLSSGYHVPRVFSDPTKNHLHAGVDIQAPVGAEIRAAADGVIVDISPDGQRHGYGNTVIIQHSDGTLSLYAHMRDFGDGVAVGTPVVGGSVVGHVGLTSSPVPAPAGSHLHFEVLAKATYSPGSPATGDSGIVVNRNETSRLEPTAWLALQGRSIASSKSADEGTVFQATFSADGRASSDWVKNGADNANKASKTISKTAGKDLNQTNLGRAFLAQQLATIRAMQAALQQMADTPPLRLLVNPQSFRVSAEKIISDGNWGRNGPVIEHWGETQDKIEGSGKIAAFYSMDAYNANGPGLTRTARQFSKSYQNLLSLWLIYKNNGGIWFPDPIVPSGSRAKNLAVVGSVYLYYDEILYVGSFDNFNLTETETAPFTLEYSFSFTVRAWFLLDHLADAQYMYGQPLITPTVSGQPTVPALAIGSGGSPLMGGNNAQPNPSVAPVATAQALTVAPSKNIGAIIPPPAPIPPPAAVQMGSSLHALTVGDNIVVPPPPVGRLRLVSLVFGGGSGTVIGNDDDTSHDVFFKLGATRFSVVATIAPGDRTSGPLSALTTVQLSAGESLVLNVATAIDIPTSLWAAFSWVDVDANAQYGVIRASIPSTTPVTIVPAPPLGKVRRLMIEVAGAKTSDNDATFGYFFNGDAGPVTLTVLLFEGATEVGQIPVAFDGTSGSFGVCLCLSGNQSVKAFLGSTPVVPLQFYGVYQEFPG